MFALALAFGPWGEANEKSCQTPAIVGGLGGLIKPLLGLTLLVLRAL